MDVETRKDTQGKRKLKKISAMNIFTVKKNNNKTNETKKKTKTTL